MFRFLNVLLVAGVALTAAHPHLSGDVRIIGGKTTTIEEHPYQVSLEIDGGHQAGGAILTDKFIISTAHSLPSIFSKTKNITVVVGSTNRLQKDRTTYVASKWIPIPNYHRENNDRDVGIIVVDNPIKFGPKVQPIQLVTLAERPKPGEMLTLTGWGYLQTGSHQAAPEVLHEIRIPTLSQDTCRQAVQEARYPYTDNMMCVGGSQEPKIAANGDSGGPAVTDSKKLAGLISWGKTRNINGSPVILTDVASPPIADFIKAVLNGTITENENLEKLRKKREEEKKKEEEGRKKWEEERKKQEEKIKEESRKREEERKKKEEANKKKEKP